MDPLKWCPHYSLVTKIEPRVTNLKKICAISLSLFSRPLTKRRPIIEPETARWEARTLPLCYAVPPTNLKLCICAKLKA